MTNLPNPEPNKRQLVVAGDYSQYKHYLYVTHCSPMYSRFANSPLHFRGFNDVEVVYYGEYWRNPLYKSDELQFFFNVHPKVTETYYKDSLETYD